MHIIEKLRARAQADLRHIILPEGQDDRTLQAARWIADRNLARLTILGKPDAIRHRAAAVTYLAAGTRGLEHVPRKNLDLSKGVGSHFADLRAVDRGNRFDLTLEVGVPDAGPDA